MTFLRLVLPGVTMIAVTYGFARFSFGLMLPEIRESLEMSEAVAGVVSSLFYLSYCFTIIYATVRTTKEGPRRMILAAGASAFFGLLLMFMAPNVWVLALGVLLAGGSTGLVSPPYGAAISLWIQGEKQGSANTWINSGTSFGIVFSGLGAIALMSEWRMTYLIYALLALLVLGWNERVIPDRRGSSRVHLRQGEFQIRGVKGAGLLIIVSFVLGVSTAPFWTFSRSFVEVAGSYAEWQLSLFWVMIGVFGIFGGFSGSLIDKKGLPFAYRTGTIMMSAASLILAIAPGNGLVAYTSAGLFGCFYIFMTGVLLVFGIRVFIENASLGIGVPFLLLAAGQVAGSSLAGGMIGLWGYPPVFFLFGMAGMAVTFLPPGE